MIPISSSTFADLGLPAPFLDTLHELGYESPSPIQTRAIPPLLEGRDLLGVAQTGTGKTAAFVLPFLTQLDLDKKSCQWMVLTPTRELAIQVAEAIRAYGRKLEGLRTLPIVGGQSIDLQLRKLRKGLPVIVGTPGRVRDHLRRGSLKLESLAGIVLDEADEMLRMGFLEEVGEILDEIPDDCQRALFSATMPSAITKVASSYLRDPVEVRIESETKTVDTVRQRYWPVRGLGKIAALARILEAEPCDGVLVFTRTKLATLEVSEKLEARGHAATPLNGDMSQPDRERAVERFRSGKVDVLVATDVAARGLDVDRVTHVINFDPPFDPESYVHRIGRTGRAGRTGEAILFVRPRERRQVQTLERATGQALEPMGLPSPADVSRRRVADFKLRVQETLSREDLSPFAELAAEIQEEQSVSAGELVAALTLMAQEGSPLELDAKEEAEDAGGLFQPKKNHKGPLDLVPYRVSVGRRHGVLPKNIVGILTNEAGLESRWIGRIDLEGDHSWVELPPGIPKQLMRFLGTIHVCGVPFEIRPGSPGEYTPGPEKKARKGRPGGRFSPGGPPHSKRFRKPWKKSTSGGSSEEHQGFSKGGKKPSRPRRKPIRPKRAKPKSPSN